MIHYKIRISCTSNGDLYYKNEDFPRENYNKLNFEPLLNTIDFIDKVLILHKKVHTKNNMILTKSLEFMCECNTEVSVIDFENFIRELQTFGFSSNSFNTIHLIKLNDYEPYETILNYKFQSITNVKIKPRKRTANKSIYHSQFLYKNPRHLK